MYLGEYEIDEYIDLVATTHRFSSGANYAPSAISYRIYENGSNVEIVTDTVMTNFDAVTGFYYDRIQLTSVLGFEDGKSYVVLIQATIDGVTSIDWRSFRIKLDTVFSNNSSLSISFGILIERIYQILNNKMNVTDLSGAVELRDINDSGTLSTSSITDNLTTTIRDKFTW